MTERHPAVGDSRPTSGPTYAQEYVELLRVVVVTGVAVGVVVIGLGARLAMLLLRLTSPDEVVGVTSDDGFEIGRITLVGSYDLLVVGAAVGCIGAVAYLAVAPWLIGPGWFRRLTVGLTAGAVGGSLLIHDDGVDFTLLKPTWLAVALFVALPLVSGLVLAATADAVGSPQSWTARGRTRWLLPLLLVAVVPATLVVLGALALPVAVLLVARRAWLRRVRASRVGTLAVRAAFLAVPVLSSAALAQDLADVL